MMYEESNRLKKQGTFIHNGFTTSQLPGVIRSYWAIPWSPDWHIAVKEQEMNLLE